MITIKEIQKKSERKYFEMLRGQLGNKNCFPLVIRSNKVLSKNFILMSQEIGEIVSGSKERKGFGYSIITEKVRTRQHGIQDIPRSIVFERLADFLKFLNKESEFHLMMKNYALLKTTFPKLDAWLIQNPKMIISNSTIWPDLLKVCQWFVHHFEPNKFYIRELPVAVHTKFIEDNKAVLKVLLDQLVPDIISDTDTQFEKRYRLKYDQPSIRFRSLDQGSWEDSRFDDIAVSADQFAENPINCSKVFIIENKMTFLAFPNVPLSIAIWGRGFALEFLKSVDWLKSKKIYYWSDLDVQGFQILSQLRSYFPQTLSFLMEEHMINLYKKFIVTGTVSKVSSLHNLSNEELATFEYLNENNFRIEQERISQSTIYERLANLL